MCSLRLFSLSSLTFIIGNNVLAEHEVVEFRPSGTRDKLTFCASSRRCASTVFPTMSIDPPFIFSGRLWAGKSAIVTKLRKCAPENMRFMREEVARLLHSGIVEESVTKSEWSWITLKKLICIMRLMPIRLSVPRHRRSHPQSLRQ